MTFGTAAQMAHTVLDAQTRQPVELAMQHLDLTGRANPAGAFLRATHRFQCKGDKPLEALYVFQLPRQGTLRRFVVKGQDFEMASKLSPRVKARKEYEEGVQDGHLSVLAESSLDGLVTLSVGQIRPGEEVTVIVDLAVGVEPEDGKFRFRYPFTLAPNYHAQAKASGGTLELPEDIFGDLILPEWKDKADGLHQISFRLHVEAGGTLGSVGSPSHKVEIQPNDDGSADVFLAGNNTVPNGDLVVDVKVREAAPTLFIDESFDTKLPKSAPRWTASIPSSIIPKASAAPRRVCFLLDRSGSMSGSRIERAVAALDAMLAGLAPEDEFGLVAFGSTTVAFDEKMGNATDVNRDRARKWLAEGRCLGGTNMVSALRKAVDVLGGPGADIMLLTDGEVWNTGPLVEQAAASGSRIHVLGIGEAAQDRFLESLSRRTQGVSKMVSVNEDVASASLQLFSAVRHPVQMDVEAIVTTGKKMQTSLVKTVWDGRPVLLTDTGKTGKSRPTSVKFKWAGGEKTVKLDMVFQTPNGLSAIMWAARQLSDLDSAIDMMGGTEQLGSQPLMKEMEDLSTAYGMASRAMSLCAVVERLGDQVGEQPVQQVVPVMMPSDMTGEKNTVAALCLSLSSRVGGASGQSLRGDVYYSMDFAPKNFAPTRGVRSRCVGFQADALIGCSVDNTGLPNLGTTQDCARGVDNDTYKSVTIGEMSERGLGERMDGSLVATVGHLMADGGMPGTTKELRYAKTVVLALALLKLDVAAFAPLYSTHRNRIADFIEANRDKTEADPWMDTFLLMLRAGNASVPNGDWDGRYLALVRSSDTSEMTEAFEALVKEARFCVLPTP